MLTSIAAVVNPKIVKFWMSRANPAMNSIPECQVPSPSTVRFRSVTTSLDPAPMTIPLIPGRTRSEGHARPDLNLDRLGDRHLAVAARVYSRMSEDFILPCCAVERTGRPGPGWVIRDR